MGAAITMWCGMLEMVNTHEGPNRGGMVEDAHMLGARSGGPYRVAIKSKKAFDFSCPSKNKSFTSECNNFCPNFCSVF